ncbi:MAG: ABC transporter substrate-binding protein [Propionibacteriales bacterium]|nr:ABC transporter substrate-binding protein [Propionibacteriales bacterium]
MTRTRLLFGGVVAALALSATGCGGEDPTTPDTGGEAPSDTIVVGSANFQENILLAEIYAEALKAKGVKVSTKLNIGSREAYIPGLKDGSIDLIPEYSGNLLQYFDKETTAVSSDDVFSELVKAVPSGLTVLDMSTAEDKDSIAVTKETASKYNLESIADLVPVAADLTFGGPPEIKTRPDGLPGFKEHYDLTFGSFKSLDAGGPLTVNALKNGQIDAGDLFTTDPSIPENDFVVLEDPENNFAAQNVLPLINEDKATDEVTSALNAVSAKLDTQTLTDLLKKVYAKQDPNTVAKDWLTSVGLI